MKKLGSFFVNNYMIFIFLISFASVVGSLMFSEIYHLDPCKLCWYQRIFMYPVAILSLVSILFRIHLRKAFILALCVPGMLIALYQYYLQLTAGGTDANLCGGSVSCNFIDFKLLGFVTIPLMSFLAFLAINIIVLVAYLVQKRLSKSTSNLIQD